MNHTRRMLLLGRDWQAPAARWPGFKAFSIVCAHIGGLLAKVPDGHH